MEISVKNKKADILIVDDTPENLQLLSSMLGEVGYRARPVISGQMALQAANISRPDLILLDINMPDMDGYEVCAQFKSIASLADVPILFISALDTTFNKVKAFEVGGVDYITKPFQFEEVLARVQTQLHLYEQRREIAELRSHDRHYFEKLSLMKDEVVHTTSRNIKNPLNTIINTIYLLNQEEIISNAKERQKYLGLLRTNADRIVNLISDLLDLARIETGMAITKEIMILPQFLESNMRNFEPIAQKKQVTLQLGTIESYFTVPFDPPLLTQVFQILLNNAIKNTPEGGTVEVEAALMQREVIIKVFDNGVAIPSQDLPYIFNKFYQINPDSPESGEETGLELSLAKSIVEQHGGRIWVEAATNGVGNTFYILLPRE